MYSMTNADLADTVSALANAYLKGDDETANLSVVCWFSSSREGLTIIPIVHRDGISLGEFRVPLAISDLSLFSRTVAAYASDYAADR